MIVYVAGPFAGKTRIEVAQNVAHLQGKALELMKKGHTVICPSWLGDHIPFTELVNNRRYWEDLIIGNDELILMTCCEAIYMCQGWENSVGASREYRIAVQKGLRILYECLE